MNQELSVVTTPQATVTGRRRADGGSEFRGIRYATGARYEHPVDVALQGSVSALEYGPICPQVPGFLEQTLGLDASSMDEDCFFLNVYTPQDVSDSSSLPVLFWIHGGAYTNGAGSLDWYHGSSLANRHTVVVSINYRLGILGFLGEENFGTEDMMSALRWTREHIASFGGNPNNITIFGESAGGSAVVSLMAASGADTLFHKAWAMSPSIGQLRTRERALDVQTEIFTEANVRTTSELAELPLQRLLDVQTALLSRPSREFDWFAPASSCNTIASNLLETASADPRPFVIGTNKDENKLWAAFNPSASTVTQQDWTQHATKIFQQNATRAQTVYAEHRPGESPHFLMSAVDTDVAFRARAWSLVDQRCRHANPTWMYWFTWATPAFGGLLGSCHALDIPFAFDNLDAPGGEMFTGNGAERIPLAKRFADEVVHFATHGHPSWQQYNITSRPTLQLDAEVTLVQDPESAIRELFTAQ